jgi:nucleotide-binding universal stress UspA family protein
MFQRALVPVDGSEPSLSAIEPAVQAVSPDGGILLCSIITKVDDLLLRTAASTRDPRAALELAERSHASQEQEAREHLQEAARRVAGAGGRVDGLRVLEGAPGPQILLAASDQECDVIVMATNGRAGWRRAILGSVADYVVRNAEEVPVLLVRRAET